MIPIPLLEIIRKYDITNKPIVQGQRFNAAVGVLTNLLDQPSVVKGCVVHADLKDRDWFMGTKTSVMRSRLEGTEALIFSDEYLSTHMVHAGQVYLHDAKVKLVEPLQLELDRQSLVIPMDDTYRKNQTPEPWCVEQFAGAFGGWSHANKFLQGYMFDKHRVIAVESHLPYAVQFALTHNFDLVSQHDVIPPAFVQTHCRDVIFHEKIQSRSWQRQLQLLFPELWMISSPCKSWSKAGRYQGFHTADGQSLAEAIAQARIFRPRVLLVEQVSGFSEHEHFPIVAKLFEWAGYRPVIQTVLDLADVTPVRRNRWLAMLLRTDDHDTHAHFHPQPWPKVPMQVNEFDASIELSAMELPMFQPTREQAALYFNKEYMPGGKMNWTKSEILQFRIPVNTQKIPTFMAAYGEQHEIQPALLQMNGLFGHFRRQALTFRFWTPMEAALLHGLVHPLVLLKPKAIAMQTVGNSIAPMHAIYLLFHAYQLLGAFHEPKTLEGVIQDFLTNRVKATTMELGQDDCAWYIGSKHDVEKLKKRIQYFMAQMSWKVGETNQWPENMYFSPDVGLVLLTLDATCDDEPKTTQLDSAISPTIPFPIQFAVMPFLVPGEYGVIRVDGDASWRTLLSLWDFKLCPTGFVFTWGQIDMKLIDTMPTCQTFLQTIDDATCSSALLPESQVAITKEPVLVRMSTDLTLYEVETKSNWKTLRRDKNLPQVNCYHQAGVMCDATWFSTPTEVTDVAPEIVPVPDLLDHVHNLSQIRIENIVPPKTDILAMHCWGPEPAYESFRLLWTSQDMSDWLRSKGRQVNLQRTSDTEWRLLFRPLLPQPSLPVSMLRHQLFFHIMQKCLASFQSPTGTGLEVIFKYQGQPILRGNYPAMMSLQPFWQMIRHAFAVLEPNRQPSLVSSGKLATDSCVFQDLADRKLRPGTIVATVMLPILGGGVSTKQEFQKMVESGAAQMFLEFGLQLPQVAPATTKLIDAIGLQRLHHILHGEGAPRKHESFAMACKAAQIALPDTTKASVTKAKYVKTQDRRQKRQSMHIDPDQYRLKEGFFLNEDRTPATILQQYSPQATGVILMGAQQAYDWLVATTALSPDELAIYVMGPINIPEKFKAISIHAPAIGADDQEVLLNGKLIQLGSKPICTVADNDEPIELKDVYVASVTVWKTDWDEQMWQGILKAPVRTLKNLLTLDGHQGIFGKPWGRMYQDKGTTVEPDLATSFQVHGEFEDCGRFKTMLKRSGFNKIFITPKDDSGKPHSDWKVIWLDATPVQLEVKAAAVSGVAGLVKGKKSYGLRIEASVFENAWKALKPSQPLPDLRITDMTFRVQPLPQGITADSLQAWGEKIGWSIKPIKAVGAKQWVVCSNVMPPNILQFNGHPLLVKQLYQKALNDTSAIAAGPRKIQTSSKLPAPHEATNVFRMGDPHMDPWKPAGTPGDTSKKTDTRPPTGPVANLLDQQEARIHAVETAINKLQTQSHAQSTQAEARFLQIESTVQTHATQTKQGFEALRAEQVHMHKKPC